MRDNTPSRERPTKEIEREQQCMRSIFSHAQPVDFIFEAFGGIGKTAQVLAARFPHAAILAADLDADCVETYNRYLNGNNAVAIQSDALKLFASIKHFPQHWGASLDFNRFTIMDVFGRREGEWKTNLIENVLDYKPTWIQITDSAVRYLHFHYKRYGCKLDPDDYIAALNLALAERWGLRYVIHSRFYAASYVLLTPSPD
jgi:hypothetical protein